MCNEFRLNERDIEAIALRVADKIRDLLSPTKESWREVEVADMCGVSISFLKKLRQEGHIVASTTRRPIVYSADQIQSIRKFLANR